jgi:Flp pilus assembly protein TadB
MELAFILVYGSLLGLMAPYILSGKENYGALLAPALALVFGFGIWTILTWVGLSYSDLWIWLITMLGMPIVMILGVRFIRARRLAEETQN